VYPNEEQRIGFSLLLKFAGSMGAQPVSFLDASVKVPDEDAKSTARDEAIRLYDPDEKDPTDDDGGEEANFERGDLPPEEELMSILFEHITIMLARVEDRTGLVMYLTLIHTKGEDRRPQPYVSKTYLFVSELMTDQGKRSGYTSIKILCFALS
jgi:hypothetical protein